MQAQQTISSIVIDEYNNFQKKISKRNSSFGKTSKDLKIVDLFIENFKKISSTLTQEQIRNYFICSFSFYENCIDKLPYKKITANLIFSKKSMDRFSSRDYKKQQYFRSSFKNKNEMYFNKVSKLKLDVVHDFEEKSKKKYFETDKCLANCFLHTTLFNSKSDFCKNCNLAEYCKLIQKEKFPKLSKLRIEKDN